MPGFATAAAGPCIRRQPARATPAPPAYTGPKKNSGKAIASVILGAFAIPFAILLIPGILAVVFGNMALSEIKRSAGRVKGKGMATAGLVMGSLSVIAFPILIIAAIAIPSLFRSRIAANESSAVGSIRTINTAEVVYATTYPAVGFTCTLAELDGTGEEPSEKSAGLIDSVLASGQKTGYRFALKNCSGKPVVSYQVSASPVAPGESGVRAFCSDQSGIIRFSSTGSVEGCLRSGVPLQ
ncbi:MAG: DUF4190 domain-containing protein [Acidobacteria bacterium]|nr:DUF4190 domain-containing protein [Acidobacteriota bacterium]